MKSNTGIALEVIKNKWPLIYWLCSSFIFGGIFGCLSSPIFASIFSLVLGVKIFFVSASLFFIFLFILKCMIWEVQGSHKEEINFNKKSKFQQRLDDYLEKQKKDTTF